MPPLSPSKTKSRPQAPAAPKGRSVTITYSPWFAETERGRVGQALFHVSAAKFRVAMAGRQSGKTLAGIAEICIDALSAKHINWWIAPSYKVRDRVWRGLKEFLPAEVVAKKHEVDLRITLVNGSEIVVKSADADESLVSESLDFAVCDEAGQWKESAWNQITPMFAARPEARAVLIGTPRGKNWFHRLWLRGRKDHLDFDPAQIESFHWMSKDSPYVSQAFLNEERQTMSQDMYMREYEANPLDNAQAVFRHFRQCVRTGPVEVDRMMVLGVDLARKIDFSCLVAMNARRQVTEIQRFQEDWPLQERRIVASGFRNNFARALVDATGEGDVLIGYLRQAGMQVEEYIISNLSKQRLIENLRVAFEQSQVTIPSDEQLIEELEAFQCEYDDKTGKYTYGAPEGMHDDMVVALALAVWGQRGVPAYFAQDRAPSYMGRSGGRSYMGRR